MATSHEDTFLGLYDEDLIPYLRRVAKENDDGELGDAATDLQKALDDIQDIMVEYDKAE